MTLKPSSLGREWTGQTMGALFVSPASSMGLGSHVAEIDVPYGVCNMVAGTPLRPSFFVSVSNTWPVFSGCGNSEGLVNVHECGMVFVSLTGVPRVGYFREVVASYEPIRNLALGGVLSVTVRFAASSVGEQ